YKSVSMKQRIVVVNLILLVLLTVGACTQLEKRSDASASVAPWEMAILAYTFRNHTFFDAVDKASELGIRYIGGFPGQPIGGGIDGTLSYMMDEDQRTKVLEHLALKQVKLMDFGVISLDSEQ